MTRSRVISVPDSARAIRKGVRVSSLCLGWPVKGTVTRRHGLRVFVRFDGATADLERALGEVAVLA